MPQIGTLLLANVFSALLPPIDPDETDFYDVLELPTNASNEQIRKAYKKASLKLHPDKVAQRRDADPTEAAQQYEKVQEAYGVLVNDEKRQRYNALGNSPTRYRFVARGNFLSNPGALYENLTSASFVDKTRLVVLCSMLIALILLQPILIASKVNHELAGDGALDDTAWVTLLIPLWLTGACVCLFWVVLVALVSGPSRYVLALSAVEHILWFWAAMRMARKWDDAIDARYASVLIPVYLAMVTKWLQSFMILQKIRLDVRKMVSLDYLETEVLKGKSLEDLTEEEREELRNDYMVVSVPPDFEPIPAEEGEPPLDDKGIEEQKVEASPEFEQATEIYNSTFGGLMGSLVFMSLFLITLTLKLDGKINGSWWVVFIPIWIYWGSQWLYYFYGCVCGSISGEEIVLHMEVPVDGEEEDDDDDDDEEKKEGDEEEGKAKGKEEGETKEIDDNDKTNDGKNDDENDDKKKKKKKKKKDKKEKDDDDDDMRPMDSSGFVDAKASFRAFKEKEKDGKADEDPRPDDEKEADRKSAYKIISADGSISSGEKEDEKQSSDEAAKDDGDDDDKDGDDDGDEAENIRVDEETFKAWQNAYEEAEQNAMQEQAKASSACCELSVKLMLVLMIVAKIEKNYEVDNDPDDVGYNTFWLLTPFFIFFGLICCCCTCLIYGASPGDASDLYGGANGEGEHDEENPPKADGDADDSGNDAGTEAAIITPPPEEPTYAAPAETTESSKVAESPEPAAEETAAEPEAPVMDDLD